MAIPAEAAAVELPRWLRPFVIREVTGEKGPAAAFLDTADLFDHERAQVAHVNAGRVFRIGL